MFTSVFMPLVIVADNGLLSVEWDQSFVNTVDTTNEEIVDDKVTHTQFLDTRLKVIRDLLAEYDSGEPTALDIVEAIRPFFAK